MESLTHTIKAVEARIKRAQRRANQGDRSAQRILDGAYAHRAELLRQEQENQAWEEAYA